MFLLRKTNNQERNLQEHILRDPTLRHIVRQMLLRLYIDLPNSDGVTRIAKSVHFCCGRNSADFSEFDFRNKIWKTCTTIWKIRQLQRNYRPENGCNGPSKICSRWDRQSRKLALLALSVGWRRPRVRSGRVLPHLGPLPHACKCHRPAYRYLHRTQDCH